MTDHPVVSRDVWLAARMEFLEAEKKFTRQRDDISRRRRALPWVRIETDYLFDTPDGKQTLAELFNGRSQLIVYHFMYGPDWEQGCASCSLIAEGFDGAIIHLAQRDVTLLACSRAPLDELVAFRARMGWRFPWVSSLDSSFNDDYHVTFSDQERETESAFYNYRPGGFPMSEAPGLSVFVKDDDGAVYHSYSCYARGLDAMIGTYQFLDLTAKGRDEDHLDWEMAWVRHHDRYDD
jgi:predicted dithiol-disulfide oxidoreductase (DUF899 family)